MLALLGSALLIFSLRVIDVSLATLRMLMVVRGRKLYAWLLGFLSALVFVVAIGKILSDLGNWLNIAGYAAGFATGNVVGMLMEERLAIGHTHLRVISPGHGQALVEHLRNSGYAVTEIAGRGRDGTVTLLDISLLRRQNEQVQRLINEIDPRAFVTAEDVRTVQRGFWGGGIDQQLLD